MASGVNEKLSAASAHVRAGRYRAAAEALTNTGYRAHNARIVDYVRRRPRDLLVLNVAEPDAMKRLCALLDTEYRGQQMPHLNRPA